MTELLSEIKGDEGFAPVHAREAQIVQFNHILGKEPGRLGYWLEGLRRGMDVGNLTEAIAPGDFPTLLGVAIQRDLQAAYKIYVGQWERFVKKGTVPNFLTHESHKVYGQDNVLDEVLPGGPYTATQSGTGHYDRRVKKYGRRFDILWEAVINDAMGAFRDIATRFSNAVIRTQALHVAGGLATAAGPNPALFGAPKADVDGQNVTNQGVLPLTVTNLSVTRKLMKQQTDPNGERIGITPRYLVVPDTLEDQARAILTSALVQQQGSATPVPTVNIAPQWGLELIVLPELETIDVSGTGDSTWYLIAEYGEATALQFDQLAGNVGPDIRIKSSGSAANPMEGDFDTDAIAYRVRDVHGVADMDPRYAYAQVAP